MVKQPFCEGCYSKEIVALGSWRLEDFSQIGSGNERKIERKERRNLTNYPHCQHDFLFWQRKRWRCHRVTAILKG